MRPAAMAAYGRVCGATLARAHARSGDRDRDRRLPRAAATPSTGRSLTFTEAYADQNERDYAALVEAARSGRITAQTEV